MYVNKMPFLVTMQTISQKIYFGTINALRSRSVPNIIKAVKEIHALYAAGEFIVDTIFADGEFEPLRFSLLSCTPGIRLNTTSRNEHVGEIERRIRTLKERIRSTYHSLPFTHLPLTLIREMCFSANYWLNIFPSRNGVSTTLSPAAIVTGRMLDDRCHCRMPFGAYVQTHEEHDNTLVPRTRGALACWPSGNAQGGYRFYCLHTGRIIKRNHWTEVPLPLGTEAIVHRQARQQQVNPGIIFEDRYLPDEPQIAGVNNQDNNGDDDDSEDDSECNDSDDSETDSEHEDSDDDDGEMNNNEANIDETVEADQNPLNPAEIAGVNDDNLVDITGVNDEDAAVNAEAGNAGVAENTRMHGDNNPEEVQMGENNTAEYTHNLRPRRQRNYDHLYDPDDPIMTQLTIYQDRTHNSMEHQMLTQLNLRQGLKEFGEQGWKAVEKELKQLHDMKVGKPIHPDKITYQQKRALLNYLLFLKKKNNGVIKGRGCADGRKQRIYTKKEDANSPTASTQSVLITAAIDAKEHRDIATIDLPGAFMQAETDEEEICQIRG